MAATLNVQFTNPSDAGAQAGAVQAVVQQAFAEWVRHFDYTASTYTINVSFRALSQPADASLQYPSPTVFSGAYVSTNDVVVGNVGPYNAARYGQRLGLALTGRGAGPADPGTLYLNSGYLDGSRSLANALAPIERELGHQFGIRSLRPNNSTNFSGGAAVLTGVRLSLYDSNVRFITFPPDFVTTFNGPNAQVAYGGPVPVLGADPGTTTAGGGQAVTTTAQGAGTLKPLDIALLRDAGLPALTDQELLEHAIARLYYGAFGRVADSAGLVQQTAGYQTALSGLVTVGDRLVGSAEFAARYGTLSDADFIRTVFQNVYGRPPTDADLSSGLRSLQPGRSGFTRGGLLSVYTQSDEARGRLSANANVTYSGTAEAQVARLYDTAFGRDADPGGFTLYTKALINGTTLQQAAQSFLGSAEFANRYGAAPSDAALVNGLYQSTLGRAPDAAAEALYIQALAAGLSRTDLVVGFSESLEHINLVAQRAAARNVAGYSVDLSPHLGIIPVISVQVTT